MRYDATDDTSSVTVPNTSTLGDYLVTEGIISPIVNAYVLQKQKIEGASAESLLVDLGFVSTKDIARHLAKQRGIAFVDVADLNQIDADTASAFNRNLCLSYGFLPMRRNGDWVEVVVGSGKPEEVALLVRNRLGLGVTCVQGAFERVAQAVHQYYYFNEHPAERLIESEIRRLEADVDRAYSPAKLLELILHLAVRERATDVHVAPTSQSRTVLMRVDGVLRPMFALPPSLDRLVSYVKLQAEMDASEQRLPQDGSFTARVLEAAYTIRVSTLISEFGERMVMRLLPERSDLDKLEDLGFLPQDVAAMERVFSRPHGLILITGPTGSGKSTTLHAALRMQPLIERNVLTVEDPVEYRVPVACQTEVNRRAGYEFASAMRYFLRHDPDIILVGEIRDPETARAALDAASTGHLVLSTLHVGGIFGVVPRLKLLGVDSETIAENLVTVINQRLVRRICPHCRESYRAKPDELAWLGQSGCIDLYRGAGCQACRGTGYLGRIPVYELFLIGREVADAIAGDMSRRQLRELAEHHGLRPILDMARQRILSGDTTIDEILRTVGDN